MASPLIAVTGRSLPAERISGWTKDGYASPVQYSRAVAAAGGLPLIAPPLGDRRDGADRTPLDLVERADGVLLAGGGDVDPSLFGEELHPAAYGLDHALDAFEVAVARAAVDRGVPVLAICRGLQVLNVALGGTLDQHIADRDGLGPHGAPDRGGPGVLHEVTASDDSLVAAAMGTTRAVVHSSHHQAVAVLAPRCRATAWTDDRVVEAFEVDDHPWCVAVQWHPEMTFEDDPSQLALFGAFVAAAGGG